MSEEPMVELQVGPTAADVELLATAFRAHGIPHDVSGSGMNTHRASVGEFDLMPSLRVPASREEEARELIHALRHGGGDGDGDVRTRFEHIVDRVGRSNEGPTTALWCVSPSHFGAWMVAMLPDLLGRIRVDQVLELLRPIQASHLEAHRESFLQHLAAAPDVVQDELVEQLDVDVLERHAPLHDLLLRTLGVEH